MQIVSTKVSTCGNEMLPTSLADNTEVVAKLRMSTVNPQHLPVWACARHSHCAAKAAANERYALYAYHNRWRLKHCVAYTVSIGRQTRLAAVDQLVPVSLSFKTGILQESVLVFDPFHWNGIIISINNLKYNNIKNIQMMDTEVIQNIQRRNKEKWKPDTTIRHASKQLMFGKKAVLLYHKNLTVKIVMPLRDYKAQYSVKINIYFSPSSSSSS